MKRLPAARVAAASRPPAGSTRAARPTRSRRSSATARARELAGAPAAGPLPSLPPRRYRSGAGSHPKEVALGQRHTPLPARLRPLDRRDVPVVVGLRAEAAEAGAEAGRVHRARPPRRRPASPRRQRRRQSRACRTETAPAPNAPEETVTLEGTGFSATFSTWGGALKSLTLEGEKFRRKEGKRVGAHRPRPRRRGPALPALGGGDAGGRQGRGRRRPARGRRCASPRRTQQSVTFEGQIGGARRAEDLPAHREAVRDGARSSRSPAGRPARCPCSTRRTCRPTPRSGGFFSGPPTRLRPAHLPRGRQDGAIRRARRARRRPGSRARPAGRGRTSTTSSRRCSRRNPRGPACSRPAPARGTGIAAIALPLDQARKAEFTLYAGPKEVDTLKGYGRSFEKAIDYGSVAQFFAWFARGLLYVMRWLQVFVEELGRRHHPAHAARQGSCSSRSPTSRCSR